MVRRLTALTFASLLVCAAAFAQAPDRAPLGTDTHPQGDAPAHISVVEGVAMLERDGRSEDAPANMPLLAGDRVRTRAGRVEILFADGSALHLDHNSAIDLQSDELLRLLDGRIRLSIRSRARDVSYRIDGPHAWAQILAAGEYRAAVIQNAGQAELEFAVLRGMAELTNEGGRTTLRAGERAFARADGAPSHAYVFNSAAWDPFDRWSEARRSDRVALSTQYLPEEVRSYGSTLDRHGAWEYESSFGYVWYPRVDYGWRPYYHGRWSTLRPYGWTWIGSDPWAWPTHHYGRWNLSSRGLWFWIPGRSWSPAWVSWAYAPGYVSWCPLGFNNRPVVGFVNVHRGGFDPWRAWTVVPQRSFGHGFVHRTFVQSAAIDSRVRGTFAVGDRAPVITGYAVPRGPSTGSGPSRAPSRDGTAPAPIRLAGTPGSRRGPLPLVTTPSITDSQRSIAPRTGFERAVPTRPMIRSDRVERGSRAGGSIDAASPSMVTRPGRTYDPATMSPYDVDRGRRAIPRSEPGRPGGNVPTRTDAPSYRSPGIYDRRPPSTDRPSSVSPGGGERRGPSGPPPASAQPGRSGPPPSGAPPAGGRTRPSGGESRGTAVRRPGGGRN